MNVQRIIKEALNKQHIRDLIKNTARYFREEYNCTTQNINRGLCPEFAEYVLSELGGETDDIRELNTEMFVETADGYKHAKKDPYHPFDHSKGASKVKTKNVGTIVWSNAMLEKYGFPPEKAMSLYFGYHVWIYYDGRHYDAEVPNGVKNWYDLPIFARTIIWNTQHTPTHLGSSHLNYLVKQHLKGLKEETEPTSFRLSRKFSSALQRLYPNSILAWHGSKHEFDVFDTSPEKSDLGAHFGSYAQAAHFGKPKLFKLNIKNQFEVMQDLGVWNDVKRWKEYLREWESETFETPEILALKNPHDVIKLLKKNGYDSIEYFNRVEGNTDAGGGNGEKAYIVFDANKIKPVNTNI